MVSLTGHGLNIIGESNVCLTFDGLTHETAILIVSDLGGDSMLVACMIYNLLKLFHRTFPPGFQPRLEKNWSQTL